MIRSALIGVFDLVYDRVYGLDFDLDSLVIFLLFDFATTSYFSFSSALLRFDLPLSTLVVGETLLLSAFSTFYSSFYTYTFYSSSSFLRISY